MIGADDIDWTRRSTHMAVHGISVEMAEEAVSDPDRLVFEPGRNSRSGMSLDIVGFSMLRERVLVVIVIRELDGRLWAATAYPARPADVRLYNSGEVKRDE